MNQILVDILKKYSEHEDCKVILDRIKTLDIDCEKLHALPVQRRKMEEDAVSELSYFFIKKYRSKAQLEALAGNMDGIKKFQDVRLGCFLMPGQNHKGEYMEVPFKIQKFFYFN